MNFSRMTVLGPPLLACLLVAHALPASAQSMEYRRGYEQGYRDGAASVQQGGVPPAPVEGYGYGPSIRIDDARYGYRNSACDARYAVQQIAEQRPYVEFQVTNELCGDPARDRVKRLDVRYHCGRGPQLQVSAREGEVVVLSCR